MFDLPTWMVLLLALSLLIGAAELMLAHIRQTLRTLRDERIKQ